MATNHNQRRESGAVDAGRGCGKVSYVRSPYSTLLSTDDPGSPACSGGLVSCWIISVTPNMAAAPSRRPTTMLAAAGKTNRSTRPK